MSFISINTEILNANIDGQALKLYCLLESYCYGDKNDCFPSQNTLAARMNKSVRTIQRYLRTLKELGLVIIKRRGSTSNLYILPKKIHKKIQETAQKIQEKCSLFKAASKNKKNNNTNKIPSTNSENHYNNLQNKCSTFHNSYSNTKTYAKKEYSHNYNKNHKTSTFNDYTQRKYNFSKLEQALLGNISCEYVDVLD